MKRGRRKNRKNDGRDKKKRSILLVCGLQTGRNSQTKGKKNNFCIAYFEEVVVVAHVLYSMVVALDVSHFERSPLKAPALRNTDPRSMDTTDKTTIEPN